jgi:hypothetical protein
MCNKQSEIWWAMVPNAEHTVLQINVIAPEMMMRDAATMG